MTEKKHNTARRNGPYMPRSRNYHLALAEYLYNELRSQGVPIARNNEVSLVIKRDDNGPRLIIDCLDGGIYLKHAGRTARIGRLKSFGGELWSEAYTCMRHSVGGIMKQVETRLNTGLSVTAETDDKKDDKSEDTSDDVVKTKDLRDSGSELTQLLKDLRTDNTEMWVIELPVADLRIAARQVLVITRDLREQHNFITIVKKLWKGLKNNLSKVF